MTGPVSTAARKFPSFGPIGKRQVEVLSQWLGTTGAYGATTAALVCYFTDWRVVVDYIPFYNGKFSSN